METSETDATQLTSQVAEIVASVKEIPAETIEPEQALVADLDVDSLSMIEVLIAIEQELGARIPDTEVERIFTIDDLYRATQRHV